MLPRLIVILALVALLVFLLKRFNRLSKAKQKQISKMAIFGALGLLLVVLALSGRLSWIVAVLGALLPLIPRVMRFALRFGPTVWPYLKRFQQNRQSHMQSRFIKLQIDMLSGELKGEVLQGELAGQKLQDLTLAQLQQLLQAYQSEDADSANLLQAYLNRVHPGWSDAGSGSNYAPSDSRMTEQQAREILGVSAEADKAEISKAHKRLMQKLHPDRGGSDYLAVQVNQARDLLISLLEGGAAR
jgi:hypothetical protein